METNNERLHILDILKAISIIFVIITHYGWDIYQRKIFLFPFLIEMAVPIFMIISGYVNSLSYINKKVNYLSEMYDYKKIIEKIIRFTIPFLIAFLIEIFYQIRINEFSFKSSIKLFFVGGIGPGSYYYPIMIQFIFIFPIIYQIVKNYDIYGFVGCFISNFIFEFLKTMYNMPTDEYRLLIFRYIGLIAFGVYLKVGKKTISKKTKIISLFIGILWLLSINYTKYEPLIIKSWAGTSMVSAFYIMPIFDFVFKKFKNFKNVIMETIGKASFNIFLTQKVYFSYAEYLIEYSFKSNTFLINIANITICVLVGIVFYFFENGLTKKVITFLKENNYFKNEFIAMLKK